MPESATQRVVIIGGGFAGLQVAQSLAKANVAITLIDKRNHHLFQPLLYQVATGSLSPANIAAPLRSVLSKQRNTRVLLGEVTGFDIAGKHVLLGAERIPFDTLVVAAGAGNFYFGHPEWEQHAPGLKTIGDATSIRGRVLSAFERAERSTSDAERSRLLTFVVVGAGPTGVEMAGAICELSRHTLHKDFRAIDPTKARIILIEGGQRVLPTFVEKLSGKAAEALTRIGVEVWTGAKVLDIQHDHVALERAGQSLRIETNTIVWAAGVRASPLGKMLAEATGGQLDRGGRVIVQTNLTLAGHPDIFVIGDLAATPLPDGTFLPGLAPVATQQGDYVARVLLSQLAGMKLPPAFRYQDQGVMATIGRAAAVVDMRWIRFAGWLAWLAWLFVHVARLIHFENRFLVMSQWAWNYFTRNRSARLITQDDREV